MKMNRGVLFLMVCIFMYSDVLFDFGGCLYPHGTVACYLWFILFW